MSAYENIELPMLILGKLDAKQRHERTLKLLEMVGLQDRMGHLPSELSGGEQQRVTIARAMANNPDILLLDEPTGDLDTHNTAIAMKLLSDLHKKGVTLIMVTHDVNLKYFADRVIWMRDGLVQRIEHTTPIQRKDCVDRMERELSQKKKKVDKHGKPEFEIRQPESYEPFAYALQRAQKNEEEQRRLMVSLGLSPDTSKDATEKDIEAEAKKKKEEEEKEKDDSSDKEEKDSDDDDDDDESEEEKKNKEKKHSHSRSSHSHSRSHHKSRHSHHNHRAQSSGED